MAARTRPIGLLFVVVVTIIVAGFLLPRLVGAQSGEYDASLSGMNEIPPTDSTATGRFTAILDEGARTLRWSLNVPSIESVTMSHIHQGERAVNGPIVLPLFIPASPADSISASGTATAEQLEGPLHGNWDAFVAALKAGGLYVNVHTTAIPSGEIRGQVRLASASTTSTATAGPRRTGTPAAPSTGQAGLLADSSGPEVAVLAVVVTVAVIGAGRLISQRSQ